VREIDEIGYDFERIADFTDQISGERGHGDERQAGGEVLRG
jgi:hypothetical protein